MRFLVIVATILAGFCFSSCAPSLKGSTTKSVSIYRGDIIVLDKKGNYQLIKVVVPYRMDNICIVKNGSIIEEFSTYKTDEALQVFQALSAGN